MFNTLVRPFYSAEYTCLKLVFSPCYRAEYLRERQQADAQDHVPLVRDQEHQL